MEVSPSKKVAGDQKRWRKGIRVWKFTLRLKSIRKAVASTRNPHHHHLHLLACGSTVKQQVVSPIHGVLNPLPAAKAKKNEPYRPHSLAIQLQKFMYTASDFIDRGLQMTPARSPMENVSLRWREIQGSNNWENLLHPTLDPWLRREVIKYGEFAQATYDAFDFDPLSEFCGSCRYNRHKLFDQLNLTRHGYEVTKYLYAKSHIDVPRWFERSYMGSDITWSKDSNWIGYVCVSTDVESQRIGRRDIVVAWRGTIAPSEWYSDLKSSLKKFRIGSDKTVKVERGFRSIYTSKNESTRYNKLSASEQVMKEIHRLVMLHRDEKHEEVSLTITGHSLGGALALLNAYEAATAIPDLFISVITFGGPRVGNIAFKERIIQIGVKTLRVVVSQDIVPKMPGIVLNRILNTIHFITRKAKWVYRHVGVELKLDVSMSPYLKQDFDLLGFHNLELYLHLVDGFVGMESKYRRNARRDVALVNKGTDMLIEELRIPEFWFQLPNKGLVFNSFSGRWVKPGRHLEDKPSPSSTQGSLS